MIEFKKKVKTEFDNYVKNYDIKNIKIKLKVDHTYRVADYCERIAKNLSLKEDEITLSWLLGILHDIGRFEQIKRYNTFNDSKSIDHAELGADILFKDGMIKRFLTNNKNYNLIENAIRYHNKYKLPSELGKKEECFANILRDADKIDILKVNTIVPFEDLYDVSSKKLYESDISLEVLDNLMNRETVLRKLKKTPVDNIVGHISFIFGLNYKSSIKIVKENGDLEKLMNFKSLNENTNIKLKKIREEVNKYIDESLR
ncbi:HD domain-containing protein [Clostridium sp. BJN0001]|uniref:HD domain-containing protein n=1 Tax=Clostridium sp. BJN0001 TaxID=2930219 RepID=UPI001FD14D3A|nr:HD domain-containing protein [Clostridium sp. BJN0001]